MDLFHPFIRIGNGFLNGLAAGGDTQHTAAGRNHRTILERRSGMEHHRTGIRSFRQTGDHIPFPVTAGITTGGDHHGNCRII